MTRIYVGNVSQNGKSEDLKSLFEDCGKIKAFNIKGISGYIVRKKENE